MYVVLHLLHMQSMLNDNAKINSLFDFSICSVIVIGGRLY